MVQVTLTPRQCWLSLACLAAGLCCPACGKRGPEVYPVSGHVLVGDRPAAKAIVTFHPVAPQGPDKVLPTAHVDEHGRFKLTTFTDGDGAPPGEYQATVVWFVARPHPTRPA